MRAIFDGPDREEADRRLKVAAQKYEKTAPKLAAWMVAKMPEELTVFMLPPQHRRYLRTSQPARAAQSKKLNEVRGWRLCSLMSEALLRLVSAMFCSPLSLVDVSYMSSERSLLRLTAWRNRSM